MEKRFNLMLGNNIERKNLILILTILYCMIFLTSCSNKLKEGDIIEKWYEPENTYVTFIPLLISSGKSATTIIVPYLVTDYEDWCIKIKGRHRGKEIVETFYVSQNQYEHLSIGDHIKLKDDYSMSDDNNILEIKK